jgi:hypothetical protein
MNQKNIFLDTSAIVGQNFGYEGPSLKALGDVAASGRAHLVTTSITIREVESNIRKRVAEARSATERYKHHGILKNLNDPALDALLGKKDVLAGAEEKLIKQFHDFLDRTKTEVIPLTKASAEDVFDKYFDRKPPFGTAGDGEHDQPGGGEEQGQKKPKGKKKDRRGEFPDAFVISALESWCKEKREKVYVVSEDSDFEEHCKQSKNLVRYGRAGEAVSALKRTRQREAIWASAQRSIEAFAEAVESEFENLGFYLDDQDGDVNGVSVKEVEFLDELSLIDVTDNVATFEVTANVVFLAEVSYDDMDTAYGDGEGGWYALDTVDTELERSEEFTLTVDAELDKKGNFKKVISVHFPPGDIAITAIPFETYK